MSKISYRAPLVSVIIPVYNQVETLIKTIESVINQTYKNLEIIVVDDGSDIDIKKMLDNLKDQRLNYYKYTLHQNANVARNLGIEKSQGEFIAMLDADDEWKAEHIEECLEVIKEQNADGVYGSLILNYVTNPRIFQVWEWEREDSMINYLLRSGYGAQTSTLFLTASSIKQIMWDPTLNRHQDYDFIIRYSKVFKLVPKLKATVLYNFTPKNYKIDFLSCMRVIQANKKDIHPILYKEYHEKMYKTVKHLQEDEKIIHHYQREILRYKKFISFQEYILSYDPSNLFSYWYYKILYIWGITFK